jgi:hypothetical protein
VTDSQNVALVRSIRAALESVDWTLLSAEERFARSADLFDPEIEWSSTDPSRTEAPVWMRSCAGANTS